jgi:hypothetical protein
MASRAEIWPHADDDESDHARGARTLHDRRRTLRKVFGV